MGCFSFLCRVSGEPINSDSFSGERCRLYLLVDGVVVEEMRGQYNSYGGVFIDGTDRSDVDHDLMESHEWNYVDWSGVCALMFDTDKSNGIAAVLERHYKDGYVPTTQSEHDPDQGWGSYDQEDGTHIKSFWQQFVEANT